MKEIICKQINENNNLHACWGDWRLYLHNASMFLHVYQAQKCILGKRTSSKTQAAIRTDKSSLNISEQQDTGRLKWKIIGALKCLQSQWALPCWNCTIYTQSFMWNYSQTLSHTHTHTGVTSIPCDHARRYAKGQPCHLPEITKTERGRERQKKQFNLTNYQMSSPSLTVNHSESVCNVHCMLLV